MKLLLAQAPAQFNYQGAARNSSGQPIANRQISLRISILDGSENGSPQYTEARKVTTNTFGLYAVQIGSPGTTSRTGTIAAVSWAKGPKFIKVEADPQGGINYTDAGTAQLLSVPFALYAANTPAASAGERGEKGERGLSAYQIWLQAGNTGTLADYLNSLKGSKGENGDKGERGEIGQRGEKGEAGVTDPKSIRSSDLSIQGGEESTLKEVVLDIKDAAVTLSKLANGSVNTDKIIPGGNDKILGTDATGKVVWQDRPTVSTAGPWYDQATKQPASLNTQSIYQSGNVGIMTIVPISTIDVRGTARFGVPDQSATIGANSAAFGQSNVASAANAMAFGQMNKASGVNAAAFGLRNIASGTQATVFGTDNTASGSRATVFGTLSDVSGAYSTSFGSTNKVSAYMSTAIGGGLISTANYQMVLGVGNAITSGDETILQVGIGDPNRPEIKANAITVMKNGNTGLGYSTQAPNSTTQVFGSFSARIRMMNGGTVAADDYTVLVKGNINLPAPAATNAGRIYYLIGDDLMDRQLSGSFRIAGLRVSMITINGNPGSRGYTVQSDGTDWVVIGQI